MGWWLDIILRLYKQACWHSHIEDSFCLRGLLVLDLDSPLQILHRFSMNEGELYKYTLEMC